MKYYITIGNKKIFSDLTKEEAIYKTNLMLALSSRLDIFYHKEG